MFINPNNGQINWTPSNSQFDNHKITFMVSDGFSMDEQSFDLYVNHPPTIISTAPKSARVDDLYRYSVVVEDKNSDRDLTYKLTKAGISPLDVTNLFLLIIIQITMLIMHAFF